MRKNIGIIILFIGLIMLLNALDIFNLRYLIRNYWPLILIAIGFGQIIKENIIKTGPMILILVGLYLQLNKLSFIPYNLRSFFWPLVLIIIGFWIVVATKNIKNKDKTERKTFTEDESEDNQSKTAHSSKERSKNVDLNDNPSYFTMFSGLETQNKSENFQGGEVTVLFGGIELDLTKCIIQKEIVLDLTVLFGGIEIKVPKEWYVIDDGLVLMGGFEKSLDQDKIDTQKKVTIKYFCLCGGIDIVH